MTLLEFRCAGSCFALPLDAVHRVLPNAQPTPLPGAPAIVLGMLQVSGGTTTVIDFRRRLGLPPTGLLVSQQLLITDISGFRVGLLVDEVLGLIEHEIAAFDNPPGKLTGAAFIDGVIRLDDGLCVICNPETFLLGEEKFLLDQALENAADDGR